MTSYWGATADPNYGYSPYSGQLHYGQHESSSEPFTARPGDGNDTTIEEIAAKIHNMHPEKISVLADQWQNAWTLLDNVRTYVLRESNLLHDEHWQSPKARDAFLQKGPGDALAYLDVWMEAVQKNVTALRHLVQITTDARRDVDNLLAEYRQKLKDAQNVDLLGQLSEWVDPSRYWMTTWDDAKQWQIKQQVDDVSKAYQLKAQQLAYKVGNQHYDYISTVDSGVGPPYRPMNAVLDTPGAPPPLGGGLPPGPTSAPPPPGPAIPPPPANSKAPPPPNPQGNGPVPPPAAPTPVPNPNAPPVASALFTPLPTPPPGSLRGPANPPGALRGPANPPGELPGSLPSGANQPEPTPSPTTANAPNPGQLTRSAFGRGLGTGQPPGANQPPGKTLRRPTGSPEGEHPNQPGRPGDRRRGERSDGTSRTPGSPADSEFGRPSGNTTPPVLKNPAGDRSRRRPGSQAEIRPTANPADDGLRRDGTAPPVLNRPNRTGDAAPPSRGRPDRRAAGPDRKAPAGASWIGAEEARADAGSSILDAAAHPHSGNSASKLEEVPKELRGRATAQHTAPARPVRPGAVAPELSKRHTTDDHLGAQHQADDETSGIVTDQQAFEVQTPGGAVVTSQRDEPGYEPEIRRALGGR